MKNLLKLSVLLIFTVSAAAQLQNPGTVDLTFGRRGVLTEVPPTGTTYTLQTVLTQPDGKIIAVVAESIEGATPRNRFALIRYEKNGNRDSTFGNEGISAPPFAFDVQPYASALQPDGKILVTGEIAGDYIHTNAVVARYLPNGSLDSSFGKNGFVIVDASTPEVVAYNAVRYIFVQPNGRIVLVESQARRNRAPERILPGSVVALGYLPNGSLDPSFGEGGISFIPMEFEEVNLFSALSDNGPIVISSKEVGGVYLDHRQWIVTLNADGLLTNQFPQSRWGAYKILDTSFPNDLLFSDANSNTNRPTLFTLKSDGQLAGIFYSATPLTINGFDFWPGTLMRVNNYRFVSVGFASSPSGNVRALVRFDYSSMVDRSYGVNGIGVGPLLTSRTSTSPVTQPDGGIIDMANLAPAQGFKLVRYSGEVQNGFKQ